MGLQNHTWLQMIQIWIVLEVSNKQAKAIAVLRFFGVVILELEKSSFKQWASGKPIRKNNAHKLHYILRWENSL